jgi:hypothetical protein
MFDALATEPASMAREAVRARLAGEFATGELTVSRCALSTLGLSPLRIRQHDGPAI